MPRVGCIVLVGSRATVVVAHACVPRDVYMRVDQSVDSFSWEIVN